MKQCFHCKEIKPLPDFYQHPGMADGRLNKCKECVREAVAERIQIKQRDPDWIKQERARCRVKQNRYRALGLAKKSPGSVAKWRRKNPHKARAHNLAAKALVRGLIERRESCEDCGTIARLEKHHEDYSRPLCVRWLCSSCHGKTRRKNALTT